MAKPGSCRIEVLGSDPRPYGIDRRTLKAAAGFFASRSRSRVGGVWHGVAVHLIGDAKSDLVHRAVMGIAGATDVVTQAYDAIPPEAPGLYGELFVNLDRARTAAPYRAGWSVAQEILLYVAHGMDHLSGADDASDRDYRAMRRRELGWIRGFRALRFP